MPLFGPITRALLEDLHKGGHITEEQYQERIQKMDRWDFRVCLGIALSGTFLVILGLLT